MKKLISLLLALSLLFAACVSASAETTEETEAPVTAAEEEEAVTGEETEEEEDEGDDSVQIPVDIPGDEEEEDGTVLELRQLQAGDEGDDVLYLQYRLQSLGYFDGEPDGKYGDTTAAAVKTLLTGSLPPTINCTEPDPACPLNLTAQGAVRTETGAVLVDSLGFGGHNAALIIKRWEK